MPDTKITALTALTTADPANDMMPIVDVSDTTMAGSGTTKRISINNILACSPSATLASATITGALGAAGLNVTGATIPANGVYLGSANNLSFSANSTLGMTLNSTGLGVGASPATRLHISNSGDVYARIATTSVSKAGVQLSANGVVRSHLLYDDGAGTTYLSSGTGFGGSGQALVLQSGTSLVFYTNNQLATANMTLDASGNLLVGTTGTVVSAISRFRVSTTGAAAVDAKTTASTDAVADLWNSATTGDNTFVRFWTEATVTNRGSITYNRAGGLVAYNVTSDYRSKDIIGPVSNSGLLIDSLKVYIGKMKGATITRPMLIAHEAQEVAPYAVTGTKDEVDADGKDKYQQMDVSSFVPLLIAEIQSLRARVQTLEAR